MSFGFFRCHHRYVSFHPGEKVPFLVTDYPLELIGLMIQFPIALFKANSMPQRHNRRAIYLREIAEIIQSICVKNNTCFFLCLCSFQGPYHLHRLVLPFQTVKDGLIPCLPDTGDFRMIR